MRITHKLEQLGAPAGDRPGASFKGADVVTNVTPKSNTTTKPTTYDPAAMTGQNTKETVNMIDVVITILPNANREWLSSCVDSLKDEPINLYFINGVNGCIGYGRAESLKVGKAQYLAFVDQDDEVVPGIFSQILPLLDDEPVHVYTDEVLVDKNGNYICDGWSRDINTLRIVPSDLLWCLWDTKNHKHMHHLNVFRRDAAMDFIPQLYMGHRGIEGFLFQHVNKKGVVKHLPKIGYKWRIHENNGSRFF